jgi:hypothetical protein
MDEIRRLRRLVWVVGALLAVKLASAALETGLGESLRVPTEAAALALIGLALDLIARALTQIEGQLASLRAAQRPPA